MARPKLDIDPVQVEKLAEIGCNKTEVAKFVGCSVDTLDRRYAEDFAKGQNNMKISLRRAQLHHAIEGNATMLVWLGKQLLDQKDRTETVNVHTFESALDSLPDPNIIEHETPRERKTGQTTETSH